MSIFADSVADLAAKLAALNLDVVTDPRAARPFSVFIELPSFDGFNNKIADVTVIVRALASPPGNANAAAWLLTTVDTIMDANLAVVSGRPSTALIGEQAIPAYDMTIRLAARRLPPPPAPAPLTPDPLEE
jgi:hypothetical protein